VNGLAHQIRQFVGILTRSRHSYCSLKIKKKVYGYILNNTIQQLAAMVDRNILLAGHAEERETLLTSTASLRFLLIA
jgi:hypothetical protein